MRVGAFILRTHPLPCRRMQSYQCFDLVLWILKQRTSWVRHTVPTSDLQNYEVRNCSFKLQNLWQSVQQQQKTNMVSPPCLTGKCCSWAFTIPQSYQPPYYHRVQFYKRIFNHQPLSTVSSHYWDSSMMLVLPSLSHFLITLLINSVLYSRSILTCSLLWAFDSLLHYLPYSS